jgi:cyclophilin family peptidyl-prolyl cis-trans isomerase/HEAT repeat protein
VPAAVVIPPTLDAKAAWILRLEQYRILREESATPAVVPAPAAVPAAARVPPTPARSASRQLTPALVPDLGALLLDTDASIRGRAAIAVGRVGVPGGAALLHAALEDPIEDVRASAAFGLGLLASRESIPFLQAALADPAVAVRGRVVEALGLIGDASSAPAVAQAAVGCGALLAPIAADDEEWPKSAEIELCRLSLYALVRLQQFDALAQVALDGQGGPVSHWWPVAFALQRSGDRRALPALRALSVGSGTISAGFALRGLASLADTESAATARRIVASRDANFQLRIAAVRLLARVGAAEDVKILASVLAQEAATSPALAIEAATALGELGREEAFDVLLDAMTDPSPAMRSGAMAAAAKVNPERFMLILSGLGLDRDWSVRASLASVLGTLPADRVTAALIDLANDEDARVHAPALQALAAVKAPELAERLRASLQAEDFVERATAAELVGQTRPADGVALLSAAYSRGESDSAYGARAAALEALAAFGGADAIAVIRRGLSDRDWPVRTRAASLLRQLKENNAEPERPAPSRWTPDFFEADALLHPRYSPRAFIETRHGVIEVQLELTDAPLTVWTFVEQARSGYFNGLRVHRLVPAFVIQTGDPRGDGAGGPGYSQRDELNWTPYQRGTMGMALDWAETAGSQWFITTSPQPHLDARYTAFGRVVGGMEFLDRIVAGDVIERVRIWDGLELR